MLLFLVHYSCRRYGEDMSEFSIGRLPSAYALSCCAAPRFRQPAWHRDAAMPDAALFFAGFFAMPTSSIIRPPCQRLLPRCFRRCCLPLIFIFFSRRLSAARPTLPPFTPLAASQAFDTRCRRRQAGQLRQRLAGIAFAFMRAELRFRQIGYAFAFLSN